jgi:uncharacterized coiled-coil DUF342 family protein
LGRAVADERNSLHQARKELMDNISEIKSKRDQLIAEMKLRKQKRNEYQRRAKELIELRRRKSTLLSSKLPRDVERLRAEIKRLEETQETGTLTIAEENKLLDTLRAYKKELDCLEKDLNAQQAVETDISAMNAEIDELFKLAAEEHQMVVKLSAEAEMYHNKIADALKQVSHLIVEANKKHKLFLKINERATKYHGRAMTMKTKILTLKRERQHRIEDALRMIEAQNVAAQKALEEERLNFEERAIADLKRNKRVSIRG